MASKEELRKLIAVRQEYGMETTTQEEELEILEHEELHQELVVYDAPVSSDLTIRGASLLAAAFYHSGMFKDVKSEAQAIVKILAGHELGFSPLYSMMKVSVIKDKIGLSSEAMAALIKRSSKYDYKVVNLTNEVCEIDFFECGVVTYHSVFTIEDAIRAGLVKPGSGWEKYPQAHLFARALSKGARVACPDAIMGSYNRHELEEIEESPTAITDSDPSYFNNDASTFYVEDISDASISTSDASISISDASASLDGCKIIGTKGGDNQEDINTIE